jgi:hypothetical protein
MSGGPLDVALHVADVLEALGIRYTVGGSLASSLSGEPRTTLDIDVVVAMAEADVARLAETLAGDFYVDEQSVRRALRQRSSVNLIHHATGVKVDLFMAGGSPLDQAQLQRRRRVQMAADPPRYLYVHTPEDILLQKLLWYRRGGEASDRQWRDVLGILSVQGEALDFGYVRDTAADLGLTDLVEKARMAAGS